MPTAKRCLLIAFCFVLAVAVMSAFVPRIAYAAAAVLVQITNTTANPVPTLATDNPGRNAVVLSDSFTTDVGSTPSYGDSLYTVPDGKLLVIDYISFRQIEPGNRTTEFILRCDLPSNPMSYSFKAEELPVPESEKHYVADRQVQIYCAAGGRIFTGAYLMSGTGGWPENAVNVFFRINGHLVSQ